MIKINGTEYDAKVVVAMDGTMSVAFEKTSQTIADIEALFNSSPKLEIWENGELVATYYDKEVRSINAVKNGELYDVSIYLVVSKIEKSVADVLQTQINNLSGSINALKEAAIDSSNTEENLQNQIDTATNSIDTIKENNIATDNAVDDLGNVVSDNATDIEALSQALDELATVVGELALASAADTDTETTDSTETEA